MFFGILIENYAGDFPLWLAPIQVRLLPVTNDYYDHAVLVSTQLKQLGYRIEIDKSRERLGKQIRNAELAKIPIVAVIGEKEITNNTLSIRTRKAGDHGALTIAALQEIIQQAIISKKQI